MVLRNLRAGAGSVEHAASTARRREAYDLRETLHHRRRAMDLDRRTLLRGAACAATLAAVGFARGAAAANPIKPGNRDVFIVVDVQNCFVPGGSLPVKDGNQVVPIVNRIAKGFRHVVMTQDWHTADHISFASQHAGRKPFDIVDLPYGKQVLWPDHCVQGTEGAALHSELVVPHAALIIRKGHRRNVDSYSAFYEADGKTPTGLSGYLKQRGLTRCFVAGLATDFCVAWTALDARKDGFAAFVIEDACRGIDTQGSLAAAWEKMKAAGVRRIQSGDLSLAA
jgi:nicotinamidase/pyrazinamidase